MCDYSLNALKSRPAKVGDKLRSGYGGGLMDGDVAVCLLPGTEVVFDKNILLGDGVDTGHKVAIFRKVNIEEVSTHHDALELPDGRIHKLVELAWGQNVTVLQMPAEQQPHPVQSAGETIPEPEAVS